MDNSTVLFYMHITGGYEFRNMISIIKTEIDHFTMILSPKSIEISFVNNNKCAVHHIYLNTQEFSIYKYNIRGEDNKLLPEYPLAFDTNEFLNTTKGIGRKDGIKIYWVPGENRINVQPLKTSTKDPARARALFVNILNVELCRYDTSCLYSDEPNVRVQAKDFAEICAEASSLKCSSLEIVGQNNSVTFKGIKPNNRLASLNKFVSQSSVPEEETTNDQSFDDQTILDNNFIVKKSSSKPSLNIVKSEDLMTVRIPVSTVKALSKIHNISPYGTLLRFFFLEGNPTKIESPIGSYGKYTVCLRDHRL
jgi:hypothetical protein